MKNFVSVNSKYYKTSQVAALEAHNIRHSNMTNKNVIDFDIRKKHNKLFKNVNKKFNSFQDMLQKQKQVQHKKGSNHNGKSNTYYQQILVLSEEQFLEDLRNGNGSKILKSIEDYMDLIEEKFGFKKLDYSLHMDEGYINEDGELKLNIHCHINYLNFDFKKEKTVLRNLRRADFSSMQDLVEKAFKDNDLNYGRGVSKKKTLNNHKEKEEFVKEKLNKLEFDIATIEDMISNIEKYSLSDIDKFKEHFKDNKKIKTILNAVYRARNNFEKQNNKYETDLERARNNLNKLNNMVLKQDKNVNAMITKEEALKIKEEMKQGKWVSKEDKDSELEKLKQEVAIAQLEYSADIASKEAENRILKNKIKELESKNAGLKKEVNGLIEEVEEAEEFINNNGLNAEFREFKEANTSLNELSTNNNNVSNHSFGRR